MDEQERAEADADAACAHIEDNDEFQECFEREVDRRWGNIVERTRAAVCYLNAINAGHKEQMAAFLDIFHPDISNKTRTALVSDARDRDDRRRR